MRRMLPVVLALFSFCAAYAAPLGVALIEGGLAGACCPKGKTAHCCKRTSKPSWVNAGSGCGGHCPGCFTSVTETPALIASAAVYPAPPAAQAGSAGSPDATTHSSAYAAFLYQRPPPIA